MPDRRPLLLWWREFGFIFVATLRLRRREGKGFVALGGISARDFDRVPDGKTKQSTPKIHALPNRPCDRFEIELPVDSRLNGGVIEPKRNFRLPSLICLSLGLITLGLYLPSLRHEFLLYDDQQYVTENPQVQAGLSAKGFAWAFGYHAGNWHPLAWLSHMLDCQVYGLNPAGHHSTNILLHSANTVLLFLVLRRLTGAIWRSACVAALFGWHPLHVESVAWVAERKDVLCACFWMLTLLAYAKYAEESKGHPPSLRSGATSSPKSKIWYAVALALFALALMSKPMAVTLPGVLLLLDFWPLRRVPTALTLHPPQLGWLVEKIPFLLLSAAVCGLTVAAQKTAIVSTAGLSILQRLTHATVSYVHYLGAAFWPQGLAAYYPYEVAPPAGEMIFAAALLVLITLLSLRFIARQPWVAVGWFWFIGTLVPVIGLVQVGDQAWADRYTYLPLIGLFVGLVWTVADAVANRKLLGATTTLIAMALLAGTTAQLRHWQNTRTLFAHAEQVTPNNHKAIAMLGSLLAKDGKLDEAIARYQTALRLKPGYPEAHFYLGNAFDQQGKFNAAIAEYNQALWFTPLKVPTHLLLATGLGKLNRPDEAATHYLAALKLEPDSAVAHNNLARLRHTQGRLDEAIEHYSAALKLSPNLAQAHNNLGIALLQKDRVAEGGAELREALRLNPTNAESQFNLALALNQQASWPEAAGLFRQTVGVGFNDANAHYQFALALAHLQQPREAMSHYASALLLDPDFPDALDGLAWILATDTRPEFRNGTEAVRMAERACELTGRQDAAKLQTLAAAYAEAGRFSEAIATGKSAHDLAASNRRDVLAKECSQMLEKFRAAKPWRPGE